MATALYVHIPYCRSKCPYCEFVSVPLDTDAWPYLRALIKQASNSLEVVPSAETLYIGGGTPTILTIEQISWLFANLRKIFCFSAHAEITVEANPCSLSQEKAYALAANGVNRLSLGVQSFVDTELQLLGRQHEAQDAARCFSRLREAGIGNISLDLIYAIPHQTLSSWRYSLEQAIELNPEHISAYCLTYEQNTTFWQLLHEGKIEKRSDEEELEFFETARRLLTRAGYEHYEISNFALPGNRSKHNTVYWLNEEYLGLGAGAVSYIEGIRTVNLCDPGKYIRAMEDPGIAVCEADKIPHRMQAVESILQQLRLREGIDCRAFMERFGFPLEEVLGDSLPELVELSLLEHASGRVRPLLKGWHLANEVALKILPNEYANTENPA
jgi:oxygen-independent coproporphyrinogen-3 oxidase